MVQGKQSAVILSMATAGSILRWATCPLGEHILEREENVMPLPCLGLCVLLFIVLFPYLLSAQHGQCQTKGIV